MADGRTNHRSFCGARHSLGGVDECANMTSETFSPRDDRVSEGEGVPVEDYI